MDSPSPRRRFQFSLRTLFVLTTLFAIPCAYVGWQVRIVRQRRAWEKDYASRPAYFDPVFVTDRNVAKEPSLVRVWLGDEAREWLVVDPGADIEAAKLLFPESQIGVWSDGGRRKGGQAIIRQLAPEAKADEAGKSPEGD